MEQKRNTTVGEAVASLEKAGVLKNEQLDFVMLCTKQQDGKINCVLTLKNEDEVSTIVIILEQILQNHELSHDTKSCFRSMLLDMLSQNKPISLIKFKGIELEEGTFLRRDYNDYFHLYDDQRNIIYHENSDGYWWKYQYDDQRNEIYREASTGYWAKRQYDDKGNEIYYENSTGYWEKRQYDEKGNVIYWENFTGYWEKYQYDDQGNQIYREDSTGYWEKHQYDDKGNEIYYENSTGYWEKRQYDDSGNKIYYENSKEGGKKE